MSKIINNLEEFLAWRGFGADEARYWARCFYKYTACGPWAAFLMKGEPARTEVTPAVTAVIRCRNGQAILNNPGELGDDFVRFLGFDADGLSKRERDWETYKGLVDKFLADEAKMDRCKHTIEITKRTIAELRIKRLESSVEIPGSFREIYYEDIGPKYGWAESACGCNLKSAGTHPDDPQEEIYVEGEHDPDCEACQGTGIARRWSPTGEVVEVKHAECVGIKIGSIVEGSDVCWGPEEFIFPFNGEDFDKAVENMGEETSFYWERDNSQWYKVRTPRGEYYLHNTWGEVEWDTPPPYKGLKEKVEEFINERFDDIPSENWQKLVKPIKIPGTRSTIMEYCNDYIY